MSRLKDKASSLFDLAFKNKPKPKPAPASDVPSMNSLLSSSDVPSKNILPSTSNVPSKITVPSSRGTGGPFIFVPKIDVKQQPEKVASASAPSTAISVFDFDDAMDVDEQSSSPMRKRLVNEDIEDAFVKKMREATIVSPVAAVVKEESMEDAAGGQLLEKNTTVKSPLPKRPVDDPDEANAVDPKRWKDAAKSVVPGPITTSTVPAKPTFFSTTTRTLTYRHQWTEGTSRSSPRLSTNRKARTPRSSPVDQERMSPDEDEPSQKVMVLQGKGSIRFTVPVEKVQPKLIRKVQNVRNPDQCLQSGEYDDFRHDLEYFMSSLTSESSSVKVKRLCVFQLAKKCASTEFRNFLRSRNVLNQVLICLASIREDPALNLSLSLLCYMMTRESGIVPFDEKSIRSLASLLKCNQDTVIFDDDYKKLRSQCWAVIQDWIAGIVNAQREYKFDIPSDTHLSAHNLVLETLTSIASWKGNQAGRTVYVFPKEDLLSHGCLQFVADKIDKNVTRLLDQAFDDEDEFLAIISHINKAFKLMEFSVAFHKRNQAFMIAHRQSLLIVCCGRFFEFCFSFFGQSKDDASSELVVIGALESCARAVLNLSHSSDLCANKLASFPDFLKRAVHLLVTSLPKFADKSYDLRLLICTVLVNIVEKNTDNCSKISSLSFTFLINGKEEDLPALQGFTKLFLHHESSAKTIDEDLDRDLIDVDGSGDESDDDGGRLKRPQEMTESDMLKTVQEAMNKASLHMEDSVCASYIGLLLGCLVQKDKDGARIVRAEMPDQSFAQMVDQLSRFHDFMKEAHKGSVESNGSLVRIIKLLEDYDRTL